MTLITQTSCQLHSIFGGGYVLEQHDDDTPRYLPASDDNESIVDFAEVLKALRAALFLQ
jgi:hypothetical protein